MEHNMGLYEAPFQSIKSGRKTVEVRLYDTKRRSLKIGDTIEFTKLPDGKKTIKVEIIELMQFPTFQEMYERIPEKEFDAAGDSISERVDRIHRIYSPEEEKKWGTLAIKIKIEEVGLVL